MKFSPFSSNDSSPGCSLYLLRFTIEDFLWKLLVLLFFVAGELGCSDRMMLMVSVLGSVVVEVEVSSGS